MDLKQHIQPDGKPKDISGSKPLFFQPKLTVNQPNDVYEQEADAMADKVIRTAGPSANEPNFFKPAASTVQRKENSDNGAQGSYGLDNYVGTLNSSGQPLPEKDRKFFEPRFGQDFSGVKIHTDPVAAKSAQSINAFAYATGNNIVFNTGQYAPDSDNGKKLMAHELTHVVQQRDSVQSNISKKSTGNMVQRAGWKDGINNNKANENIDQNGKVVATTKSTILRIPIEGIKLGNQDSSMTKKVTVTDPVTKKQTVNTVPVDTTEHADGKAIALVPDSLDATKPVEILLHLHGHNEGNREVKKAVRDISLDKIEQQMISSGHTQMLGILPQGTTNSDFGTSGFDSDAYIKEVLGKVQAEKKWAKAPGIARVILSAHSGGGNIMETMLKGAGGNLLPGKLQELALFEAINGPNELAAVKKWVSDQIQKDVTALKAGNPAANATYLAQSMRFRGYYTPKGDYVKRYEELDKHIKNLYKTVVDTAGLNPADAKQIKDNYQVIVTAANGHNEIMGKDSHLQDSFTALPPL